MTTTDRPSARAEPRIRLSALEWRLYLTALLSGGYSLAWLSFAARVPAPVTVAAQAPAPVATAARAVWLRDVPESMRPTITLPSGWKVAAPDAPASRPAVVRRAETARPRIRTRAS